MEEIMEPKIIFEDADLLVLDKPSGMVVNRCESQKMPTLQDWLQEKGIGLKIDRNGIVHRLDKETSGLILVAKSSEAMINLQQQFKDRRIEKEYVTLAHGKVRPEKGEINAPITRNPFNRQRFGVFVGGRISMTQYTVLANFELKKESFSYILVKPKTGRTHQIRVHFKYLGYPVVSDELYGGRKTVRRDRQWCPRLWLQAIGISFIHPVKLNKLQFKTNLSEDLRLSLNKLKKI